MVGAMKVGGYWSVMPWLLRAAVGGGAIMVQPHRRFCSAFSTDWRAGLELGWWGEMRSAIYRTLPQFYRNFQ